MNNLTTHMAELRRILATIESKNINEGTLGDEGVKFAKRLVGKSGKELVKELGPRVEIATVIKKPKMLDGKKTGEFAEREVKEVWELIPNTEIYTIKSVDLGKGPIAPKTPRNKTADIIKDEVETAAREGRSVKSVSTNAGKSAGDPVAAQLDPAAEATAKAEKLSIPELEKKIASKEGTAIQQKAYADELAKKKGNAPKPEAPKDKFDSAEVARKKAQGMTREDLEAALKNKDIPAVTRKEYEAELAKRPKSDAPKSDTPREEPPAPTTGAEVLVKKTIEREKAVAKTALDDGIVKIRELENASGDAAKKFNEPTSEHLERLLTTDSAYKGTWEGIVGTEKEVGFWKRLGRKAMVGGLISIPVLLAAAGAYLAMRDPADDEDEVLDGPPAAGPNATTDNKANDGKPTGAETNTATDGKPAGAETNTATDGKPAGDPNQAPSITGQEEPGAANKPAPEQNEDLAKLKAQIDALIAELSKSKDPAIQKRLAAVRAKLGMTNQAGSVTPTEKGGWKNIGNNYRRWYGPDGYDAEGSFVKRGDLDTIPYDAGQVDKWSKMSDQEKLVYLRNAERAGKLK